MILETIARALAEELKPPQGAQLQIITIPMIAVAIQPKHETLQFLLILTDDHIIAHLPAPNSYRRTLLYADPNLLDTIQQVLDQYC